MTSEPPAPRRRQPAERLRRLAAQVRGEADKRQRVITPDWIVQLANRQPPPPSK